MPVRKVVTRSGKKFRGRSPSRKNKVSIAWESLHERDAIRLFEYSANVISYEEQPSEETFYVRDVPHSYYPDFRLRFSNEQVLDVEVKPERKLRSAKSKEKYGRIAAMYKKSNRNFRILTERDYRAQPLHANLERIHEARLLIWREADAAVMLVRLGSGPAWTLEKAAYLLGNVDRVLALVACGALCMDLHAAIEAKALVWLPGEMGGGHDPIQF